MELTHKIYKLVDAEGKPAKFSNIADLRILVEGWDFDIPVVPKKENGIKFFNDAAKWEEDCFEAFSIFEKFTLDNAGYLVHEGIHLSFVDSSTKMELRIKEIVDPPLLMVKFPGTMNIDDENHNVLTVALKQFYSKAIESAEAEVTVEEEPVVEPTNLAEEPVTTEPTVEPSATTDPLSTEPVSTDEPVTSDPGSTTDPVVTTEPAVTEPTTEPSGITDPLSTEPVATTEPVTSDPELTTEPVVTTEPAVVPTVTSTEPTTQEPVVTTEPAPEVKQEVVIEASTTELEEDVIPKEVLKKFEGYRKDLVGDGYEEYSYKNYRVFYREVAEGALDDHGREKLPHSDIYVLLLTPAGVMEIDKLVICDDESNDEKVKYQFKLKGERKSAYINRKEASLVVKKPKKKEEEKA